MNSSVKLSGLTSQEVKARIDSGKVNIDNTKPQKTVGSIMVKNIFTLFNMLNAVLAAAVFMVGSYKNMLFMGVVFFNTVIGIVQELRSKQAVDKLTIITGNNSTVIRDGKKQKINNDDIVLDDVLFLERGSQIPADCEVINGQCHVNESLLTGESELIRKTEGDTLMSGSFINSGSCYAKAVSVGADKYASKLNNSAKYYKKTNSEILTTIKKIIKVATCILIPLGIALFVNQFFILDYSIETSVVKTVGALIGMIPEGLVLLTSTVLAVSVIRLSKRSVLVQDLYCIETLARVDVLCLDKTGTLTCDEMLVTDIIPFDGVDREEAMSFLANVANNSADYNSTMNAVRDCCAGYEYEKAEYIEPFSSEKKCSSVVIGHRILLCGAGEFILNEEEKLRYMDDIKTYEEDHRVLTFIEIEGDRRRPICNVLLKDKLRKNAKETLEYFKQQQVTLKIISGDSVNTIVNIAKTFDIEGYKNAVDCSTLKTDEEINSAAEKYTIFGRVTPQQKEKLIKAMHNSGHSVAMTGDGVNDVLALKCADCSVAMASGSEAAKCVSQIVLADNDFSSMPHIVAEGRRTIHNIQRSASLFLVKNIFSILISVFVIFFGVQYPFRSIQLSFVGGLTIGLPSFILALEYSNKRVQGHFFLNIISGAVPSGITVMLNVVLIHTLSPLLGLDALVTETLCVMVTAFTLFSTVAKISFPFNRLRSALVGFIAAALVIVFVFLNKIINTAVLDFEQGIILLCFCVTALIMLTVLTVIVNKIKQRIMQSYKD